MTLIPTRFSGLCALFTALFLSAQLWAATPMIPAPPTLAAKSWLLMDAKTGYIITEYNADQRLAPASLTKMMTTYIASEQLATGNIGYDDMVRISEKAWRKGGSKCTFGRAPR